MPFGAPKTEEKRNIAPNISCHAWNKDGTMCALSPNNNEVWIYETKGSDDFKKWDRKFVLAEHTGFVSGIDWSPVTGWIVTCSHDRNAYVWKNEGKTGWSPELVILRINRAATDVKWSPKGDKFAVSSGAKCVPVCHYEDANNWWVSKMIKKHKSTVLSLDWCPNNKFIVTGSSDNKCRIFSAYIKGIDDAEDDGFGEVFPQQHKFGEVLAEFDQAKAWVHSVAWSPAGFRIAFAGHGSTISFAQIVAGADPIVQTLETSGLPFTSLSFVSDNAVVAAGWGCNPTLFTASGDAADPAWEQNQELDSKESKNSAPKRTQTAFAKSLGAFAGATDRGVAVGAKGPTETKILTRHKNTILGVALIPDKPTVVTTCSVDGTVLFWDLAKLNVDCAGLGIA